MIETINALFGIENDISVPIIISLLVFITGGLVNLIVQILNNFNKRRKIRITFKYLLSKTIDELLEKEIYIKEFYSTIDITFDNNWSLRHKPLSYLDTFFELEYMEVFLALGNKGFFSFKQTLKEKAFHKAFACIRILHFVENQIKPDLDFMITRFEEYHNKYNTNLKIIYEEFENIRRINTNKNIDANLISFLKKFEEINYNWLQSTEVDRNSFNKTHHQILIPILKLLTENQDFDFIKPFNIAAIDCTNQFKQMQSLLKTYNLQFKSHYYSLRSSRRNFKKIHSIL